MINSIILGFTTIIVILLVAILSYNSLKMYYDNKINIEKIFNEKVSKSESKNIKKHFKRIEKKEIKIITFLKALILRANLRSRVINVYTIIAVSIVTGIILFKIGSKFLVGMEVWLVGIFGVTIPSTVLYLVAEKVGDKTNLYFIDFLTLLQNYLEIKDDINFAMHCVSNPKYKIGNLTRFINEYIFDTSHGYDTEEALIRFSSKIDNEQIKDLVDVIIDSSKTSGKYLMVVGRYATNYMSIYDELLTRKKSAKKKRRELWGILLMSIALMIATTKIQKGVFSMVQSTIIGQALISFFILSLIILFFIGISVGRFDFD